MECFSLKMWQILGGQNITILSYFVSKQTYTICSKSYSLLQDSVSKWKISWSLTNSFTKSSTQTFWAERINHMYRQYWHNILSWWMDQTIRSCIECSKAWSSEVQRHLSDLMSELTWRKWWYKLWLMLIVMQSLIAMTTKRSDTISNTVSGD